VSDGGDSALVLFSGGQDSTTCLAWALQRFGTVETIAFDYGQRHRIELNCQARVRDEIARQCPDWAPRLGRHHDIDLGSLGRLNDTALTSDSRIATGADGLPTTFVPGRNLVFLTVAAAVAYGRDVRHLVGGMCETDYSGYPDCRDDTIKAMQVAINLGMARRFVVHTPLMWIDKAATWALAQQLGGATLVELVREHTHTCYEGTRDVRHAWGYGCGACPACRLRADGYARFAAAEGPMAGPFVA
jgi:7-cyano-7-deazaguanine synthase